MFDVDMIKPFIQSRRAMAVECDGTIAETTPELRLVGQVDAAGVEGGFGSGLGDAMLLVEVLGVCLLPIEDTSA